MSGIMYVPQDVVAVPQNVGGVGGGGGGGGVRHSESNALALTGCPGPTAAAADG